MQLEVVDFAKDRVIYNASGCTREELENKLNLFFASEGYSVKSSTPELNTYEKGTAYCAYFSGPLFPITNSRLTSNRKASDFRLCCTVTPPGCRAA